MKPTLPTEVTLGVGDTVTWSQFCRKMANDFNIKYAKSKVKFDPGMVESFAIICMTGADFNEDAPKEYYEANEAVCVALEKSKEYENMTPEDVEVKNAAETLAGGLLSMGEGIDTEDTTEPILEASLEEDKGDFTILARKCDAEYIKAVGNGETPSKELSEQCFDEEVEPIQNREVNSQELLIITEASKVGNELTLEDAKAELEKVFDLGNTNQLRPKGTLPITPMHLAQAMVFGAKTEQGGAWIYADAVNMLMNLGLEHPVEQIASMLGKSDSTLYNYARTARKIPKELRDESVPITVYSEIVNRRYDEDESKNNDVITELANKAVAEKWSCNDARSHADLKQGKQPKEKKAKYRYIVILPGLPPYLTVTQPGYSAGTLVIDIKANEYLKDTGSKIEFVPLITEPTDEQIRELQGAVK